MPCRLRGRCGGRLPALTPGQQVEFEWICPENPSGGVEFEFECVWAWPAGKQPFRRLAGFGARAWSVHPDGRVQEEHFTGLDPSPWTQVVDYAADASVTAWALS